MAEPKSAISRSINLVVWIDEQIGEFDVPSSKRTNLSLACAELTRQHHRAVIRLCENQLFGSAAAILRTLFESYVKAIWLFHCAAEQDLDRYIKGDEFKMSRLIHEIERTEFYGTGVLAETKSAWWIKMCSFAHSGIEATGRQIDGDVIQPVFDQDEIVHLLQFADSIALLAGIHIANVRNDVDLSNSILAYTQALEG